MSDLHDPAVLATEARWVRALARGLVVDDALADDLAQDAWVAALQRAEPVVAWRAWCASVVRRRLFERRREEAARAARERHGARGEALPSTVEMVERAATHQSLVEAVLALEEPYRTTVLWRYFEDLSPRAIAQRSGIPVATVHTRLARARERLRARLDREHGGDRTAWMSALVPFAPGSAHSMALGGTLLKTSTKVVAAVLLVLGTAAVVWQFGPEEVRPGAGQGARLELEHAADAEPLAAPEEGLAAVAADAERRRSTEFEAAQAITPVTAPAVVARTLRGRVIDHRGQGLSGVRLRTSPSRSGADETLASGAGGRFEIANAGELDLVHSDDARWTTVLAGSGKAAREALVVVAPRIELAGRVVDELGAGVRGADVTIDVPRAFGSDFDVPLDGAVGLAWRTSTDTEGAFALAEVPALDVARILVAAGGFEPSAEAVPAVTTRDLVVVLRRGPTSHARVRGIVVDARGAFVRDARVAAGSQTTLSDSAGRFELDLEQHPRPTRVTAVKRGLAPAFHELAAADTQGEIVLRLEETLLAISGRVLDGAGRPVAGARVWLEDATYFGFVGARPVHVETLVARDDAPLWSFATTTDEGAFRIDGLLDREYHVAAIEERTLLRADRPAVRAGERDLVLRLPADELHPRVHGQVVDMDGQGVGSVRVQVQRPGITIELPGGGTFDEWAHRAPLETDAEGRFELLDVPKKGAELFANGEPILFQGLRVEDIGDPLDVRLAVHRRMHLRVELDPPLERADSASVLDGDGAPVILRVMRGETSFTNRRTELVDGRSHVLSLSDAARTLVLSKAGVEVARIPIVLVRGETNVVRW